MFHIPKSTYSFATSSFREFMTSSNDGVEVPPPTPVVQGKDQSTEDYYRDDMAVFEVEDVLFRVPKCLFEPGPGRFGPLLFDEKEDEDSDGDAISLPDLTADEFRSLVDFFLPYRCLNRGDPSLQHWINLLSISTKYQLDSIRPVAIKGIDAYRPEIDPVEKYALAVKYTVNGWEASSFKILCQRPDPLTVEEAKKLGVVIVTKIFTEREKILSKSSVAGKRTTKSPQPSIESTNLPRGPVTVPDSVSKISQSNPTSKSSAATTTKPVANSGTVTSTPPNNTTKVKLESSEEQNILSNPQPAPSQPNNGRLTNTGSLFAPAPPLFPPPVPGKVPSLQQSGNDLTDVFLGFTDPGNSTGALSKKPPPSGPTSTTPQGQGHPLFSGVITSDSLFAVKPTSTQKTPKDHTLPSSASQSKFVFGQ